jgi:hypothetical protein
VSTNDPHEPLHEPALPVLDEEARFIHDAADRFEHASAQELLAWALDRFHPRMAISAAGGVDGMAIIDMAWQIDPNVRVFTVLTGWSVPTFRLGGAELPVFASRLAFDTALDARLRP